MTYTNVSAIFYIFFNFCQKIVLLEYFLYIKKAHSTMTILLKEHLDAPTCQTTSLPHPSAILDGIDTTARLS